MDTTIDGAQAAQPLIPGHLAEILDPTPESIAKAKRVNDVLIARGEAPIPPRSPEDIAAAVSNMIGEGKATFKRIEFAMKKRYPADYKDYIKRFDGIVRDLAEHRMTNTKVVELLLALEHEIKEHPVYSEVSVAASNRESMLSMFADNHKITIFGGKTCIRREAERDWILPDQLRQFNAHWEVIGVSGKPQNVVSAFMEWEGAPRYGEVIFNPAEPGHRKGYYNLWQGWTVEPEDGNDDACWWEVLEAACGYNLDYVEYVTKWFADIFQHPTRKPGTAIGISGRQGIGKSALVETVGMLLANIKSVGDARVITGAYGDFTMDELLADYNEHVANKLLVYLDEATWGGSHVEAQRMKKIITKQYENINPKFLGRIQLPCYRREVFSSNNEFYYRPDKDDRRLLPLEYDTSKINEKSYDFWKRFYAARDEGKMLQNLLFHFQQLDLAGWEPQEAIKRLRITTGQSMLDSAKQPWEHWLQEIAEDGEIVLEVPDEHGRKLEIPKTIAGMEISDEDFQEAYLLWTRKHKQQANWYADQFKKERTKMLGEQVRKMSNGHKFKVRCVPSSAEMLKRLREGQRWVVEDKPLEFQPDDVADRAASDTIVNNVVKMRKSLIQM